MHTRMREVTLLSSGASYVAIGTNPLVLNPTITQEWTFLSVVLLLPGSPMILVIILEVKL